MHVKAIRPQKQSDVIQDFPLITKLRRCFNGSLPRMSDTVQKAVNSVIMIRISE